MSVIIGATSNLFASPTRMQNKRGIYILLHSLSSVISYAISVPLLIKGYYIIALPLAGIIASFSIDGIFWVINRKWFSIKLFDKSVLLQLLKIGLPIMPTFLVYWIFSSADRLMISGMIGKDVEGMYSIGAKVAQVSQLIYMAFASGWQYFAFSTMKDRDQVEMTSKIFEYMMVISFTAVGGLCCFNQFLFNTLFTGEYVNGQIVAPYLFMAPLLQMLFQIATTQFMIKKNTLPIMIIIMIGAVCNIICNWIGITLIGMEGAAISTLIGYLVSLLIALFLLIKRNLITISRRSILACIIFVGYFFVWRFFLEYFVLLLGLGIISILIYIVLYKKDITNFINLIKNRRKENASD